MRAEDNFTSTVDGAAGFESHHGQEYYDDGPDLSDVAEPEVDEDLQEPPVLLQPYEVLGGDPDDA